MPLPLLLLVDDAPELGDIVLYVGKRAGIEIASCLDVPSAWEFLQQRRPDLLLVDVNLPGVRGPELCRRVRSTPSLTNLAISLFSHWGLPADIAEGLAAGADYVVSKELIGHPVALRQRLEEILGAKDSRQLPDRVVLQRGTAGVPAQADWPDALNQTLRAGALRQFGPEVLRIAIHLAIVQARSPALAETALSRWITADGLLLGCPALKTALDTHAVVRMIASLAGQMERLLGAEASRPIREALAGVVPGLSGLSTH